MCAARRQDSAASEGQEFPATEEECPLGNPAGVFAVYFGLALTEGVALGAAAGGGFDAANATPAITMLGGEWPHVLFGVMHTATVAKQHFCHYFSQSGRKIDIQHDRPVLQVDDIYLTRSERACLPVGLSPV